MALLSQDKTISGDIKKARIDSRKKTITDLDLSLTLHPIRKDIIPLRDDNAIKNSIKNLLQTNRFERPFQSSLGANLRGLLFEPADAITKGLLKDQIKNVINRYEPRVFIQNVLIEDEEEKNAYRVQIQFIIKEFDIDDSVEIVLRRLR
tara:strand:+ start:307 stop:753 length:447 start_codon:yes stop_codon:yes gene_type:complete